MSVVRGHPSPNRCFVSNEYVLLHLCPRESVRECGGVGWSLHERERA